MILQVGFFSNDFTKDLLRILRGFYEDFTNFYGFVKKMVQKNQQTYNIPPGPSANPYGKARSAELRILLRILLMILQLGVFSKDFTKDFTMDLNWIL